MARAQDRSPGRDGVAFAVPLPLESTTGSNIRSGPGVDFGVAFTVGGGTYLIGHSHSGEWIHVEAVDGREGWIHHTLVRVRGAGDP